MTMPRLTSIAAAALLLCTVGCDASAELEGSYACTGEEREVDEEDSEAEPKKEEVEDSITITVVSESEVELDSALYGRLRGEITGLGNQFVIDQEVSGLLGGLGGAVRMEATGTVSGGELTFEGSYGVSDMVTVTFELRGQRQAAE